MIKERRIKQAKDEINSILKGVLVKGEFKAWPYHCRYPIIELEDEVMERNFKNLKSGIIYESGIEVKGFSKNEKTESERVAKKFKI